jgi:Cu(I)/Ag(I) efflux system membrane fusion protein
MHPEIVAEQPGDCSLCEMPLEKVPDQRPQPPDGVDPAAANSAPAGKVLSIPSSAVLDTGRRKIAYRKTKAGEYELVELHVGPRASAHDAAGQVGSYYPILHGVQEGDEVVVRGGFLLDSQRQIEGLPSLLSSEGASGGAMPAGHKH